jgi:hypothetical protein
VSEDEKRLEEGHHQPAEHSDLNLGHEPPKPTLEFRAAVGEMHAPPVKPAGAVTPPPKRPDAARSVQPRSSSTNDESQ